MPLLHRYRRLPLRAKLSLWVSLGASAVVVGMMLAMLLALEKAALHSVTQVQSALVDGVVRDVDGKLGLRRDALVASAPSLGERLPIEQGPALEDYFASRPLFGQLFTTVLLADVQGRVVYNSEGLRPGVTNRPLSDRAYFKEALQTGKLVVTPPLISKVGSPVVGMAVPVRDPQGRITGVLIGMLRLDQPNFVSAVSASRLGDGGYVALMTDNAAPVYVAHPDPKRVLQAVPRGGDPGFAAARRGALETREGRDGDGTPALITHRLLTSAPWRVEAVYPTTEAFAGLRSQQRMVVLVGSLVAAASGLLVWWSTSVLLAPLQQLRRALELDATGSEDLLRSIHADGSDIAALLDAYYAQKNRRVATEAALVLSERRLRSITDNLPAFVAYLDKDGVYRHVNEHYRRVFGIDPATLLGKTISQGLSEEVLANVAPHMAAVLRGEPQTFEHQVVGHAEVNHLFVNYVPDIGADGQIAGFYSMTLDITARRRAELQHARSERRLKAITDSVPALIAVVDKDVRYRFANAQFKHIMGVDPEAVIGKSMVSFLGPQAYEKLLPQIEGALRGERCRFERTVAEGHVLIEYVPEVEADGKVSGFVVMVLDITERKRMEEELRTNQELLDRTGAIAGIGGWSLEISSNRVSWTGETRRIHEVDDDFVPTLESAIDFYAQEGRPAIEQAVQRAAEDGTPWDLVLPLRTAKGRSIWVRATGAVEFEHGRPTRMVGAFQDVSQRVEQERLLREQAELLQITLKSIGDGVITTDERGRVRWLNPAAERMTGWTSEAASGHSTTEVFRIVHADTRAPAPDPVALCLATLEKAGLPERTVLLSISGQETAIEDSASPIHDANGGLRGAVLVFHDVSEQRRMSDQMTYRATHDSLTGLVNRAEFDARLARVLARPSEERVENAMLFIDLDQFKLVNDACGHAMGDKLLCQVSELLRATVRSRDTLARLGGDEFAVILEHCSVAQAQRVAQSICDRMEEFRFVHEGRRFRIGASIGLVPVDARFADAAAAQHAADAACYAAKEAGRNRVHVWFDTDAALRGRDGETQWGSRLEAALDDNDFVLFAQQIESIQRDPAGLHFEILIRLREADGTIVAPGRFLPAAERFHMASRIDRWVVRRVFEWLASEGGSPADVATVSVNLSGQSIGDRAFHRYVVELLHELPIDAKKLCFEVTETAAITNLADAAAFIRQMRGVGMRVALDDFGAGASSFGYLKNLPVDYLKIDGQFVRNIETDPLDMAAVRCFHEVARAIGVETIAEFVETEAIREVLRGIGIDHVQGFLVHRPEPLEDLLHRVRLALPHETRLAMV